MTRPIVIRIGNPHAGRPVMVSDYEPTAEAAVQLLYSAICQHFIYHPQLLGDPSGPSGGSLIDWWPELRNAHSGEVNFIYPTNGITPMSGPEPGLSSEMKWS